MKPYCMFLFIAAVLASPNQRVALAQNQIQQQSQEVVGKSNPQPKIIKSPVGDFPTEALKKKIEGKVVLTVVVNEKGRVTDAKVLSGPPEFYQVAIDSVKQWEFEPPAHPPVETKVEIGFGYPKECPGPISDSGEVGSGGWLTSKKGAVVIEDFDTGQRLPPYFEEDRKAGIAGVMILSIAVAPDGRVKNVHVVKSLSHRLDEAAMETVRRWRFKLIKGSPDALPDDFELPITYRATCNPKL
jgi:TonB family protein